MKSKGNTPEISLEDQLKRLEEISMLLDRGELPLDEQLKIFEEGMKLAQVCREYLDQAKLVVERLGGDSH
ncbi:MAG: exodeoxyribonuclease VII small subunit [Ignavibacteria bacterium]|nr:exodeoxyribonuclease VII small subunit [Ignavibacteria bacterium]